MKSSALEELYARGAFQIQPLISDVNFSNNVLIPHIT